jgi:hypothetical protein
MNKVYYKHEWIEKEKHSFFKWEGERVIEGSENSKYNMHAWKCHSETPLYN